MVCLTKMRELHLTAQALYQFVVDDDELLVGGRVDEELVTFLREDLLHPHGHLDGVFGETEIQDLSRPPRRGGEERIELQADKGTLGDDGSVLLLDGEEVLVGFSIGEDNGLATEGSDLRATNIEDIAMAGQIG